MAFNVNKMVSSINKSGVAQASHFEVFIDGPSVIGSQEISLRAESANLPGRTLMTSEHKPTNYGPINKIPYGQVYGDSTVSFLMSEDLREKDYFEQWQTQMVDTGSYAPYRARSVGTGSQNSRFNTKYFHDYAGTITIRQFGSNGGLRTVHKLNEAYPVLIGEIGMDWNSGDLLKLQVTFAYRNYEFVTEDNSNQPGLGLGFSFNLSRNGFAGSLRVPGFGSISGQSSPAGVVAAASPQLINQGAKALSNIVNTGANKLANFF